MHPASTSSGADSASAAAHAELAVLETAAAAAAAAVEQARQRAAAAAARAAARAPASANTKADAEIDPDAETDGDEYEVEGIVSTTRACDDRGGKAHAKQDCKCERTYLVKWKGYDAEGDNTWESEEQLMHNAKDVLTAFKVAHKVPPYHQPSRSSSRSSSNASQTAAAAAAATANAAAPSAPTVTALLAPKRANSNTPYSNGSVKVVDPPSDGACGSHALCIGEGVAKTSIAHVLRLNDSIASVMERDADVYASAVADEDTTDAATAVAKRAAALRASTARYHLRSADFDAYAQKKHRVAVVSASTSGTTTQHFGRNTAPTTIVLIHVGCHYRVLIHTDDTRTFKADQIENALEFARAHAAAWYTAGASAPPFPDTSAADRKPQSKPTTGAQAPTAAAAATAAATAAPDTGPAPALGAPAPDRTAARPQAKQNGDGEWQTTHRLKYAKTLVPQRTIVVTTNPPVTDISFIEQRLRPADVTLSQFVKRWTLAQGGAVHVEAATPAMYTALLDSAANIRQRTRKTCLIDLAPLKPAKQPDAKAQGKPHAKQSAKPPTKAKPAAASRPRGDHSPPGRGSGKSSDAQRRTTTPKREREAKANADAPVLLTMQQMMQQQMQLVRELIARPPHQTANRTVSPHPPSRRKASPERADSGDADEFEVFKQFKQFKARKALMNAEQPVACGAPAKRDRSHRHHNDGDDHSHSEGDDGQQPDATDN